MIPGTASNFAISYLSRFEHRTQGEKGMKRSTLAAAKNTFVSYMPTGIQNFYTQAKNTDNSSFNNIQRLQGVSCQSYGEGSRERQPGTGSKGRACADNATHARDDRTGEGRRGSGVVGNTQQQGQQHTRIGTRRRLLSCLGHVLEAEHGLLAAGRDDRDHDAELVLLEGGADAISDLTCNMIN